MADFVDFNDVKRKQSKKNAQNESISEIAALFEGDRPDNALLEQTARAVMDKAARLALLTEIAREACTLIKKAGFDPGAFELDEDALNYFLIAEIDEADLEDVSPDVLWNGPRYCFEGKGFEVRVASTVAIRDEESMAFSIDILKLDDGKDHWKTWVNGKWQAGPPEDAFEYIDAMRTDMLDDDDDGAYPWFDDDGDDAWESGVESMLLPPNVIRALLEAGIEEIDALKQMTDEQLLAIKGIGKKSLADIHDALEFED